VPVAGRRGAAIAFGAMMAMALAAAAAPAEPPPLLGAFFARLARSGHAEVRIERGATSGSPQLRGRVTLEPPDRVRVEFDGTGECVTLRADGGEWLQPELRQLVRLGPARAREALLWWDLLLGPSRDGFGQRVLAADRVLMVRGDTGDSVVVTLGRDALPSRLRLATADGAADEYRLDRWSFGHALGRRAFELRAPRGYETTTLR
jgi:hypothetical protein